VLFLETDQRLFFSCYTDMRQTIRTDWDVLSSQPFGGPFYMDSTTCDPLASGLITREEAMNYFTL